MRKSTTALWKPVFSILIARMTHVIVSMLAYGQVAADDYDLESIDQTLNAKRIRLIPVKVKRIPIACGQQPYVLHLCRELEEDLALHKTLVKHHQEIHEHLRSLSEKVQDALLCPQFDKLGILRSSQVSQVSVFSSRVYDLINADGWD
jgi:hypothetical protein